MDDELPEDCLQLVDELHEVRWRTQPRYQARANARDAALAAHKRAVDRRGRRRQRLRYTTGLLGLAASLALLLVGTLHSMPGGHTPNRAAAGHVPGSAASRLHGGRTSSSAAGPSVLNSAQSPESSALAVGLVSAYDKALPRIRQFQVTLQREQGDQETVYAVRYPVSPPDSLAAVQLPARVPSPTPIWRRLAFRGPLKQWAPAFTYVPQWLADDQHDIAVRHAGAHTAIAIFSVAQRGTRLHTVVTIDTRTGLVTRIDRTAVHLGRVVEHDIASYEYRLASAAAGT